MGVAIFFGVVESGDEIRRLGFKSGKETNTVELERCYRAREMSAAQSAVNDGDSVLPGDYLCAGSGANGGLGTILRSGKLYSTLAGRARREGGKVRVESALSVCVPTVGSVVVGRVDSVSERQAKLTVLSVSGRRLQSRVHGSVKREDIRAVDKDTVEVFSSFRPGDIVRAKVLSLGDSQLYTLSTGEAELGVVLGRGEGGDKLVPLSWCEMQGVSSGGRERRKVAKVINAVPAQ